MHPNYITNVVQDKETISCRRVRLVEGLRMTSNHSIMGLIFGHVSSIRDCLHFQQS